MGDPGSLLILFAIALMMVTPIHVTVTRVRFEVSLVAAVLHEVYPPVAPSPDLTELVRQADEALASDPLISATAAIAETYDQA